jgi:hypothetical protein
VDKNNFSWLFLALLFFLIGVPVADDLGLLARPGIRALFFSALLAIGIWSLRGAGRAYSLGRGLAIGGIVLNVLAANIASQFLIYASFAAFFGFLLIAILHSLKHVVFAREISVNRLVGAVCIYLLLGVIWSIAYTVIDMLHPDSFQGILLQAGGAWDSEWLYFSFVTMTTLGYGDISPISSTARGLAYMQSVFGQFYIAILVAGLVSAYILGRQSDDKTES